MDRNGGQAVSSATVGHAGSAVEDHPQGPSNVAVDASEILVRMVGPGVDVLAIGDDGLTAARLLENGCSVTVIAADLAIAARLGSIGAEVISGAVEEALAGDLAARRFDALLCAEVLQDLVDPGAVLAAMVDLVTPEGHVVVSLPHVCHIDVRLAMLSGAFPYSESGLLSRRHLHFFSREGVEQLVRSADLIPLEVDRTYAPAFSTELSLDEASVVPEVVSLLRDAPEAETYQFLVKAVKRSAVAFAEIELARQLQLRFDLELATRRLAHLGEVERRNEELEHMAAAYDQRAEEAAAQILDLQERVSVLHERASQPLPGVMRTFARRARSLARRTSAFADSFSK